MARGSLEWRDFGVETFQPSFAAWLIYPCWSHSSLLYTCCGNARSRVTNTGIPCVSTSSANTSGNSTIHIHLVLLGGFEVCESPRSMPFAPLVSTDGCINSSFARASNSDFHWDARIHICPSKDVASLMGKGELWDRTYYMSEIDDLIEVDTSHIFGTLNQ